MADFVQLAHNKQWPHIPDPQFLNDGRLALASIYVQDIMGSDPVAPPSTTPQDPLYNQDDVAQMGTLFARNEIRMRQAILWPQWAAVNGDYLSFIVAGVVAFYATPALLPQTGIGAALVSGYAAGAAVRYLQSQSEPNPNLINNQKK